MDEIKVGEYIRTKDGFITKILGVDEFTLDEDEIFYETELNEGYTDLGSDDIIKHSSNIIDLIEQGDYVNGIKIFLIEKAIGYGDKGQEGILVNKIYKNCKFIPKDDIKSIVTKEQFKNIEYTI